MTQVSPGAAYIRKQPSSGVHALRAAGLHSFPHHERMWDLLETPQTIKSLQRAVEPDAQLDLAQIEELMARLLDSDLIELSPDS